LKPMGDVKVKKLGRQLLINIPRDVVEHLKLKPDNMNIIYRSNDRLVLEKGHGPVKIVDVGRGKLRIYIDAEEAPFKDGDRVLVTVDENRLVIERIDYYIVKPTVKPGNYYKINVPWELVREVELDKYPLVKVYREDNRVVVEPLDLGNDYEGK